MHAWKKRVFVWIFIYISLLVTFSADTLKDLIFTCDWFWPWIVHMDSRYHLRPRAVPASGSQAERNPLPALQSKSQAESARPASPSVGGGGGTGHEESGASLRGECPAGNIEDSDATLKLTAPSHESSPASGVVIQPGIAGFLNPSHVQNFVHIFWVTVSCCRHCSHYHADRENYNSVKAYCCWKRSASFCCLSVLYRFPRIVCMERWKCTELPAVCRPIWFAD